MAHRERDRARLFEGAAGHNSPRKAPGLEEGGFEVLGDFEGNDAGVGEIDGVLYAFAFELEDVEVDFVAFGEVFVLEGIEGVSLFASPSRRLITPLGIWLGLRLGS